jgi:hypothetical protein
VNKLILLIIVFLSFSTVSAFGVGGTEYGVNYQLMQVDDNTKTEMQVSSSAHALGLYFIYTPYEYSRTVFKHWQSTMGADLVYIKDESPFNQLVAEENGNGVSNKESKVLGYSAYLETGLSFYISEAKSTKVGLMVGYKYNDIVRTIFKCRDCRMQDLRSFNHSAYLKPFISFTFLHNIDAQVYFTHYLSDSGFKHGVGLQVNF